MHQMHMQTMPVQMNYFNLHWGFFFFFISPVASKALQSLSWDDKPYVQQFEKEETS